MQLSQGQIEEFLFRGVRLPHPADEANISIHQGSVFFKPWESWKRGWLHSCSVTYTHNVMIQTVHITFYS